MFTRWMCFKGGIVPYVTGSIDAVSSKASLWTADCQKPEGHKGKAFSLLAFLTSFFFLNISYQQKKKKGTGINRHSCMTGLMFSILITRSESLWKLMACSVLKETLPEWGEIRLPAFAFIYSGANGRHRFPVLSISPVKQTLNSL